MIALNEIPVSLSGLTVTNRFKQKEVETLEIEFRIIADLEDYDELTGALPEYDTVVSELLERTGSYTTGEHAELKLKCNPGLREWHFTRVDKDAAEIIVRGQRKGASKLKIDPRNDISLTFKLTADVTRETFNELLGLIGPGQVLLTTRELQADMFDEFQGFVRDAGLKVSVDLNGKNIALVD